MKVKNDDCLVFFGDSITEWGRDRENPTSLGTGYVKYVSNYLLDVYPTIKLYNRGIGGNHIQDLNERIHDCLDLEPSVVILLIGINDVWHGVGLQEFGSDDEQERFEREYVRLLTSLKNAGIERVLLIEPFVLDDPVDRLSWREDLNKKIRVVRNMAKRFQFEFVPLDGLINEKAIKCGAKMLTGKDGVHPTPVGAAFIAKEIIARLEMEVDDEKARCS